jgi:HK97 family phage major capsid protein
MDLEAQIVSKRDQLEAHLEKQDDSNVSDADLELTTRLNAEIVQLERTRAGLVEAEKALAGHTAAGEQSTRGRSLSTTTAISTERAQGYQAAAPAIVHNRKELDPIDYIVRSATVTYLAKAAGKTEDEIRQRVYGDDAMTKVVCDMVTRSASAPALTTVTGWAAELAQTVYTALMPLLMPNGLLPRLAAKGLTLAFGTAGRISIPTRSRTPTLAGSFVGEGLPIPVRQGAFTSQLLTPKKMAVITTWTREMNDHSTPAIEGLLREAIQQDTAVAVDSVLIDANPATVIRPAGLLNGVSVTTATSGGGIAALIGDITGLVNAIAASTFGNVRNPAWLMNPTDVLRASLATAANTGVFPFRDEVGRGTLNTIPIIDSSTVPAKTVILVDAADFVMAGGGAPRMEMSDQATLHMEDTTPLELVASPSTVAAPQRSLFQTDSLALRMVLPLNWVQRRAGTVAWTQNVTW